MKTSTKQALRRSLSKGPGRAAITQTTPREYALVNFGAYAHSASAYLRRARAELLPTMKQEWLKAAREDGQAARNWWNEAQAALGSGGGGVSAEESRIEDGGPAFPVFCQIKHSWEPEKVHLLPGTGISARDFFAVHALQGLMSSMALHDKPHLWPPKMAEAAYGYADAMLAARKKEVAA